MSYITHEVSQENLDANPLLIELGAVVGDSLELSHKESDADEKKEEEKE